MDASTWNLRAAQCEGKEAFSTPQIANKVQRRRAKKRGTFKTKQQVYHCKCCGKFHIGTRHEPRQDTKSGRRQRRAVQMEEDESMA